MNKFFLIFLIFLTNCSQSSPDKRINLIDELNSNKFNNKTYTTSYFDVYSLEKIKNDKKLTIYIEGDGLAWISRRKISTDPTPTNPLAFKLALNDENENIIYLARPCQYVSNDNCNKNIWTISQYSTNVLKSYKEIINHLSKTYKEIHLVGYSGGAGIVMYLGTIENESVKTIRTVAGNINHNELTKILNISQLKKSINFYSIEKKLKRTPQIHYYGLKDITVPNELHISYKKRNQDSNCISVESVDKVSHNEGWLEFWKSNSNKIPSC